jgi:hypothetical protein
MTIFLLMFVSDFIVTIKICQGDVYVLHINPGMTFKSHVFHNFSESTTLGSLKNIMKNNAKVSLKELCDLNLLTKSW